MKTAKTINQSYMNNKSIVTFILLNILFSASISAQDAASFVNPMIGTAGMGHCFPGACAPFGAVQLSPETDTIPHNINGKYVGKVYEYCAGY